MTTKAALIVDSKRNQINKIASLINRDRVVVLPYGKKERRVFALVGSAHSPAVIKRILKIKKRSPSQALAISGIPEVAPIAAELNETLALVKTASRTNKTPEEIIQLCFQVGAIGLILRAQKWLPKEATIVGGDGQRTVLIAGETTEQEFDIFPDIYRRLIKKYGKIMVGTSANLSGEDTYHVLQQEEALEKLKDWVDVFVYEKIKIGFFPIFKHLTSTTMIDLTGEEPEVIRWGNVYPGRFKKIFPSLIFNPKKIKKYKQREHRYHLFLKKILPFKGLLQT